MKDKVFRCFAVLLTVLTLAAGWALTGAAAELRDYRLPSEKKQSSYSVTVSDAQKGDSLKEFQIQIAKLTPAQKKQLRESFSKKIQSTAKEDEKKYYSNLIRILDESETRPRIR